MREYRGYPEGLQYENEKTDFAPSIASTPQRPVALNTERELDEHPFLQRIERTTNSNLMVKERLLRLATAQPASLSNDRTSIDDNLPLFRVGLSK